MDELEMLEAELQMVEAEAQAKAIEEGSEEDDNLDNLLNEDLEDE